MPNRFADRWVAILVFYIPRTFKNGRRNTGKFCCHALGCNTYVNIKPPFTLTISTYGIEYVV